MLVIRFKSEALDENWELIKYRINNHDTQSFTRESREPVSVHQAIVSRINPRGGREWAVKQLPHNNDWQGIIYLNRACRPGRRAQTNPVAQIHNALYGFSGYSSLPGPSSTNQPRAGGLPVSLIIRQLLSPS